MLRAGIKLFLNNVNETERIHLSNGSLKVEKDLHNYLEHYTDAFVPNKPWRTPNPQEQDLLYTKTHIEDRNQIVCITSIPQILLEELRQAAIKFHKNKPSAKEISEMNQNFSSKHLNEYLLKLTRKEYKQFGFLINEPDKITTTLDRDKKKRIGLHLDNWDHMALEDKHMARNRISMNVGYVDRYLLFFNLTVQKMHEILCENNLLIQDPIGSLGDIFMESFPEYPIIKIRISPGEAYIAPTENMIHDGCTLGTNSTDVSFVVMGGLTCAEISNNSYMNPTDQEIT